MSWIHNINSPLLIDSEEIEMDMWVTACFMQDSDYSEISDMGIQEMAEHMAQWDYGNETDMAHSRDGKGTGTYDREYNVTIGGLDYILSIGDCYASLIRRPIAV